MLLEEPLVVRKRPFRAVFGLRVGILGIVAVDVFFQVSLGPSQVDPADLKESLLDHPSYRYQRHEVDLGMEMVDVLQVLPLLHQRGHDAVSMKEIAQKSLYGVASLYRWFSAKKYNVVGVGVQVCEEKKEAFLAIASANRKQGLDGYHSFINLMNYYESIFQNDPSFFVFLDMFDNYVLKEKLSEQELSPYNDVLMQIQVIFLDCARKGI